MRATDIIAMVLGFIFAFLIFSGMVWVVYNLIGYAELKDFMKQCDEDFGIGKWTYNTTDDGSCSFQNSTSIIITNRECSENGVKINCDDIDK